MPATKRARTNRRLLCLELLTCKDRLEYDLGDILIAFQRENMEEVTMFFEDRGDLA